MKKRRKFDLGITLSVLLNVAFYLLVIFLTFFIVSFDVKQLLPRWEVFIRYEEAGRWFWQQGYTEIVPKGTRGAYFVPGVLLTSGIVNSLGFMLFMNTRHGRKLALTREVVYLRNIKTLGEYNYLISDEEFGHILHEMDQKNKKDTWIANVSLQLQKHQDKIPRKIEEELYIEQQSRRTKRWIRKRDRLREQLDPEWIDENLGLIRIRYPKINRRMIVNGVDDVKVSRLAITDIKAIERKETQHKLIKMVVMFGVVVLFTGLSFPMLRQDVWMLLKDYIVYTASLAMNIMLGIMSANRIHEARIQESQDRLGYIKDYVGDSDFKKTSDRVIQRMKNEEIEDLENRLFKLKQVSALELQALQQEQQKQEQELIPEKFVMEKEKEA